MKVLAGRLGGAEKVPRPEQEVVEVEDPVPALRGLDLRKEVRPDLRYEGRQDRDEGEGGDESMELVDLDAGFLDDGLRRIGPAAVKVDGEVRLRRGECGVRGLRQRSQPGDDCFDARALLVPLIRGEQGKERLVRRREARRDLPDLGSGVLRKRGVREEKSFALEVEREFAEVLRRHPLRERPEDRAGAAGGAVEPPLKGLLGEVDREELVAGSEVGVDSRLDGPFAEQAGAEGVDGRNFGGIEIEGGPPGRRLPLLGIVAGDDQIESLPEPGLHLARRFLREGHRGDLPQRDTVVDDESDDPGDERRRLPGPRRGFDEKRRRGVAPRPFANRVVAKSHLIPLIAVSGLGRPLTASPSHFRW